MPSVPKPIELGTESGDSDPKGKRRRLGDLQPLTTPPEYHFGSKRVPDLSQIPEQVLDNLIQMAFKYRYPGGTTFKSDGQKKLLWACLQRNFTLAVLPTGGGKSIAYELPPLITTLITVAIIPFKRILKQAYKRAYALGISVVEWVSATNPLEAKNAGLLLVSIEAALARPFHE
jgi:hypothetical protein